VAPALVDLAMHGFDGTPYVLGRWQSAWFERRFGSMATRVRAARRALDPEHGLNRGVLTGLRLHGPLGSLLTSTFEPGIAMLRATYDAPAASWLARLARGVMGVFPGPAAGRGAPAVVGARFRSQAPEGEEPGPDGSILLPIAPRAAVGDALRIVGQASAAREALPILRQTPEDRALHCVNCGECNTVCPIYHESRIRLPQMLTHAGEALRGGEAISTTTSVLLDLCMRCGNCEEVCQAGIPHLPLYDRMQLASDAIRPRPFERHVAIVSAVRTSPIYRREFLNLRGGGYLKRSPASLPGVPRFVVMRSENDAGPAASCIHCGACVPVCPTHANREFEGMDPRWITTVQNRCIGCGTCVEVCPANLANGGQTLRVMEAPTPDWFAALVEFDATTAASRADLEPSAASGGDGDGASS
jgi:ferredoxin